MDLEVVERQAGAIAMAKALAAARSYAERSLSESTRRGYARDLAAFQVWCMARSATALPAAPQMLAAYLADLALTDQPATIGRKLAAIAVAQRDAGLELPTEHGMVNKRTLSGIRREKGTAPHQKVALLVEDLRGMVAPLGASLLDRRDRALILLGFAAALRRSELVALRVDDVRVEEEGLVLTLRRSKNEPGRPARDGRCCLRQRADDVPRASPTGMACRGWARRRTAVRRAHTARRLARGGARGSDGGACGEAPLQSRRDRSGTGRRAQLATRFRNGSRAGQEARSDDQAAWAVEKHRYARPVHRRRHPLGRQRLSRNRALKASCIEEQRTVVLLRVSAALARRHNITLRTRDGGKRLRRMIQEVHNRGIMTLDDQHAR